MILSKIIKSTTERLQVNKARIPETTLRSQAESIPSSSPFALEKALRQPDISFICEVKRASPSKGVLCADFPYLQIAKDYENAGAAAISCVTEPIYFQGSDSYLKEIACMVSIPVLRKDFILDPYMLYESKVIGASAVLLIASLFDSKQLKEYLEIAHSLGLSALVEAHTEREVVLAVESGARIVGVNNRNLHTFNVDITTSLRLRNLVPKECVFVSESGIATADDIKKLREYGVDSVLIGECLMRAPNKKQMLDILRSTVYE